MGTAAIIILGIVALVILTLSWRRASRSHALPCPVWLAWMVELDNPFTRTNRAAFIVDRLDVQSGMDVLDAGCGPGRVTIPLAKAVGREGRVVALDVQEGMLARIRKKATSQGLDNIELLHAALGEGQLPYNQFDRALLVTVLGEIPDRERALAELFSCLKPGGVLAVTEVIFDPHFQRRSTVTRLCTQVGFAEHDFVGNQIAFIQNFIKPNRQTQ